MDLKARVQKAKEVKADLFLSIHCNAAYTTNARGTEAFINDYVSWQSSKFEPQTFFSSWLLSLAKSLTSSLAQLTGTDRGVKYGKWLYVISRAPCPAILLELGFITNPEDRELLLTKQKDFITRIANCLIQAFKELASSKEIMHREIESDEKGEIANVSED
jgi:N-acetylmuramoyl-L-alanine amidase